ncbi:MAG: hypothetical protein WBB85_11010 [Albidovulum sp.]|uniref:hypothetical protein n=1 Tax=Albidovulum sp. TaxID=1872424 RepID=UPI003C9069F1
MFDPPRFVAARTLNGSREAACHLNALKAVDAWGGEAVTGWAIWQWQKVMLQAEHHCVWKDVSGRLFDVTPQRCGEAKIVFCVDSSASFDPSGRSRRDNVRKNISDMPEVDSLISLEAAKRKLMMSDCWFEGDQLVCRYDEIAVAALQDNIELLTSVIVERVGIWPA